MAEETGCAILLVRHLNKTGGAKAVYRGGGSIGIIGACRSAWLIAKHPDEERQRVVAQVKNNLARPQPSLAYEVVADDQGRPQVAWLGEVDVAADQLVQAGGGRRGGGLVAGREGGGAAGRGCCGTGRGRRRRCWRS